MAHAQKPDLVFQRNGRVPLNWRRRGGGRGGQFSRLLAAEVCASAIVMLDTPCSEVECKTTGFPLHSHVSPSLPLRASPCAITFQLESTPANAEWGTHQASCCVHSAALCSSEHNSVLKSKALSPARPPLHVAHVCLLSVNLSSSSLSLSTVSGSKRMCLCLPVVCRWPRKRVRIAVTFSNSRSMT